jgi:hypothetical protein
MAVEEFSDGIPHAPPERAWQSAASSCSTDDFVALPCRVQYGGDRLLLGNSLGRTHIICVVDRIASRSLLRAAFDESAA